VDLTFIPQSGHDKQWRHN